MPGGVVFTRINLSDFNLVSTPRYRALTEPSLHF